MTEALKGVYNRRHPERPVPEYFYQGTDYYRIIEGSFEEFERSYPDRFEEKYGYLRTEVMKAVYSLRHKYEGLLLKYVTFTSFFSHPLQ